MTEKQKILVVDDEKHICDNVGKILAKGNYEVEKAQSAQEALEKLSQQPFSMIISDIVMPGMNGLELLKQVKKDWPLTKALIMTAYGSTDTAVKAMQLGALDYISKPFTPDELRKIINLAASEKLVEAQVPEEIKEAINIIDIDIPFDPDEVAKYTGEDYVKTLSRSDMPVVEVKKPEHYCEMGHMVCEIFKKLGKTCKAGMKTQECPQKKGKKAAKKASGPSVKKLIGIDMPFNYEEVTAMTGPEYVASLQTGEVAFMPYEQLKAKMAEVLPGKSAEDDASVSFKSGDFAEDKRSNQEENIEIQDAPAVEAKTPEHYCEMGQMVCEIFKKLGKTCKAGMKTQLCPQKKAKKAAKKSKGPDVKTLIGVDMPFDYEQVAAMTGTEYATLVDRDGYAVTPYEELKARMQKEIKEKQEKSKSSVIEFPGTAVAENVLVIDDEAHIAKNIRKILSKKGYEVDQAVTKDQAFEKIKSGSYDLVLLDLKIPGVKGLEMLKAVRKSQPEARVVIITGYASIESAKESARLGIVDYVHKPFTPDEIRNAAETALVKAA